VSGDDETAFWARAWSRFGLRATNVGVDSTGNLASSRNRTRAPLSHKESRPTERRVKCDALPHQRDLRAVLALGLSVRSGRVGVTSTSRARRGAARLARTAREGHFERVGNGSGWTWVRSIVQEVTVLCCDHWEITFW